MRGRFIIAIGSVLLLLAIVMLPRISEAGRFKWFAAEQVSTAPVYPAAPVQDQKFDITVVASYQNDTSVRFAT